MQARLANCFIWFWGCFGQKTSREPFQNIMVWSLKTKPEHNHRRKVLHFGNLLPVALQWVESFVKF
jgi:hypothetical protein